MSKALFFMVVADVLGVVGVYNNLENPLNIALFGSLMICAYLIFMGSLNPTVNYVSYFMASSKERADAKGDNLE